MKELDAKVAKHAALSNENFITHNENSNKQRNTFVSQVSSVIRKQFTDVSNAISQLNTLTEEQAKLSDLFHLHVRACSEI